MAQAARGGGAVTEPGPPRLALAVPHTPWVPARVEHLRGLLASLDCERHGVPVHVYTERASHVQWSGAVWSWLLASGAEWCVVFNDDVEVCPDFFDILRTQLSVIEPLGAQVLGLSSVHPGQVDVARQGHRWYHTRSWLVGWAYAIKRDAMAEFLAWRETVPERVASSTEDHLINCWVTETERVTWHSVPALVDHCTDLQSNYGNDTHVMRRPWVRWTDFARESLTDPGFWRPSGPPPFYPVPVSFTCWGCLERAPVIRTTAGVRLCGQCIGSLAYGLLERITGVSAGGEPSQGGQ